MNKLYLYIFFFSILEIIYIATIYKYIAFPKKRLTKKQYIISGIGLILAGAFLGMFSVNIDYLFGIVDLKTIINDKEILKEVLNFKAILFITNTTFLFLSAGVGVNILTHGLIIEEKVSSENHSIYLENRLKNFNIELVSIKKSINFLIVLIFILIFFLFLSHFNLI